MARIQPTEKTQRSARCCGASAPHLRENQQNPCPEFHGITPALFGIDGYCILRGVAGQLMIPSLDEHRRYCTTTHFPFCPHRAATARGVSCPGGPSLGRESDHGVIHQ